MPAFRDVGSEDSHCSILLIVNAGTVRVDRAKGERKDQRKGLAPPTSKGAVQGSEQSRGWKQR